MFLLRLAENVGCESVAAPWMGHGPRRWQAAATQLAEQSQMLKHLLHGHLLAQEGEVHLGTLVRLGRLGLDSGRRRRNVEGAVVTTSCAGASRLWPTAFVIGSGGAGGGYGCR